MAGQGLGFGPRCDGLERRWSGVSWNTGLGAGGWKPHTVRPRQQVHGRSSRALKAKICSVQDGGLLEEFKTSVGEVLHEPLSVGICSEMTVVGSCGVKLSGCIDFSTSLASSLQIPNVSHIGVQNNCSFRLLCNCEWLASAWGRLSYLVKSWNKTLHLRWLSYTTWKTNSLCQHFVGSPLHIAREMFGAMAWVSPHRKARSVKLLFTQP